MTRTGVIVDTDVWSEFYRKRTGDASVQVQQLRTLMQAFPDEPVESFVYELAAKFFNLCRSRGVQGSHTDFLICACSVNWGVPVLSKDADYGRYAEHVPVRVYSG